MNFHAHALDHLRFHMNRKCTLLYFHEPNRREKKKKIAKALRDVSHVESVKFPFQWKNEPNVDGI